MCPPSPHRTERAAPTFLLSYSRSSEMFESWLATRDLELFCCAFFKLFLWLRTRDLLDSVPPSFWMPICSWQRVKIPYYRPKTCWFWHVFWPGHLLRFLPDLTHWQTWQIAGLSESRKRNTALEHWKCTNLACAASARHSDSLYRSCIFCCKKNNGIKSCCDSCQLLWLTRDSIFCKQLVKGTVYSLKPLKCLIFFWPRK